MKKLQKLLTLIFAFVIVLCISSAPVTAESYFTNNKALDSLFTKLEKTFAQYKKDEIIRPEYMSLDVSKKSNPWPTKKISNAKMKTAREEELNHIRAKIEIIEERLGGFSKAEYKIIENHITDQLFFAKTSEYGWDTEGKVVSLNLFWDEDFVYQFNGLLGNFARMGKEKDEVDSSALKVKGKITKYLNQSKRHGNKIGNKILENLPSEVEKLFIKHNLSKIETGRVLSNIHEKIYNGKEWYELDGTSSVKELVEAVEYIIEYTRENREQEKLVQHYQFSKDEPTSRTKELIIEELLSGKISKTFSYGFSKAVTIDNLARLYFENVELDEKIVIEDNLISADSPDYVKNAFIYGMLDDDNNIDKKLTRLEAARVLINGANKYGMTYHMPVTDYGKIPAEDLAIVGTCISSGMDTFVDKFKPTSKYIKEDAIKDVSAFEFDEYLRYGIPLYLSEPSKISMGKDSVHIMFNNKKELKAYLEDHYRYTILGDVKLTTNYTRVDTGGMLIEVYTANNGIKFTIKKGVKYINFKMGMYGPKLEYVLEPKVLKSTDKVNMTMVADSTHTILYKKIDPILKKIIKKGMTDKEKVKAIHDYVVLNITYDINYANEENLENLIKSIDKGKGVCGDYAMLFKYLCLRESIPCVYEADWFTLNHGWNAVFVGNKWLFVDTTWDDSDNNKVRYTYFLVDKFTFMRTHLPKMGIADNKVYRYVDKMNIKTQEELRGYLLDNFYWMDGYKMTFRMADKKMKPIITYMHIGYNGTVTLTYDAKKNLYTISAKNKK